ncbi:hypothetical protein QQZ08_007619 [Neonectria magnoliae]|uniref:Uncharacterized protein n=1 Tax=Neonectria magnoliae TaxID=2732573 RepID=A0ABR1HXA3_9HYPO
MDAFNKTMCAITGFIALAVLIFVVREEIARLVQDVEPAVKTESSPDALVSAAKEGDD